MVNSSYGQPDGAPSTEQKKLGKYFQMAILERISEPASIVNNHGKILVWYLPNILSCSRVVSFFLLSLNFSIVTAN
jgi:hypothetical protein